MYRIVSRAAAALMAAVMCLGFSACGKKNEAVIASKEHIYSVQRIELTISVDNVSDMLYANDKLYIIGNKFTDLSEEAESGAYAYKNEIKLQIVGLDGTLEKETVLLTDNGTGGGENLSSFTMDKDGNILAVKNVSSWGEGGSANEYFLVKYDGAGNVIGETSLKKLADAVIEATGNEWFSVDYFQTADDGTMFMACNGVVCAADEKGNFKYILKNDDSSDGSVMNGVYKTGDGRLLTSVAKSRIEDGFYITETKLYEIDTENQSLGAEYTYEQNGDILNGTDKTGKYDLLILNGSGLSGYDIETGTAEVIVDWLKSGFDAAALQEGSTTVLPDGRILCVSYDYEYNGNGGYSFSGDDLTVNILTEIDPAKLPDRKLVKIYTLYLNMDLQRQVIQFNRDNTEYEIELTSYDDYAANSYADAITKLNNDMIAGNLPDIIVLNSNLPVDSYISKGLLADLYEFMDKDETVNREYYTESVFKAVEKDGKLYELVPKYDLTTIVGKTSEVGSTQGWTMEEFMQTADKYSDKSVFGREIDRDNLFDSIIRACYGSYINRETGECSFNSDDFIGLMEFAAGFPKEEDVAAIYDDPDYFDEYQAQYREGKTLLAATQICTFTDIVKLEEGAFDEPITFKGFPGVSGNGTAFRFDTELAITSKAANPDGAWEFIKYFLSDEYQDVYAERNINGFPIKRSSLQKKAEASKERPYWENDDGEKEYYYDHYFLSNDIIDLSVNTDEDNQRIFDLIDNTEAVERYDKDITNIITEEAASFFEGQKSAEEAAEIIQNRVSNYIAENR